MHIVLLIPRLLVLPHDRPTLIERRMHNHTHHNGKADPITERKIRSQAYRTVALVQILPELEIGVQDPGDVVATAGVIPGSGVVDAKSGADDEYEEADEGVHYCVPWWDGGRAEEG